MATRRAVICGLSGLVLAAGVVSVGSAAGLQSFLAGRPAWSWTLARTRVDVRA